MSLSSYDIASLLNQYATILEIAGDNPFCAQSVPRRIDRAIA